jgi:hypothetical protein
MVQEFQNFPYEVTEINNKKFAIIRLCTWEQLRQIIDLEFNFTLELQKEGISDYKLNIEVDEFFTSIMESIPTISEEEEIPIEDVTKRFLCQAFLYGLLIGKNLK